MDDLSFFDESTEQSHVKAILVSKYFWSWAKIIMPRAQQSGKIAYIDLFAGPGRYKDGTKSTPLLILEQAVANDKMRTMLVTIFNDANPDHSESLEKAIASLPGMDTLKYQPYVSNELVGERIVQLFESSNIVPTLLFVDPWGYKGLSLRLINSVLKNWGCDCIFFFNYNRINMGLSNLMVQEHMNALFGQERADVLRTELSGLPPNERELAVVEAIGEALKTMGGTYVLPFRFRNAGGARTSHHLIFVSKNVLGYTIMKEIMAKESSDIQQGVASFEYNPAPRDQGLLFELSRPLDELGDMLLEDFAGRTATMKEIYERHHIGKRFIKTNYKSILLKLEVAGEVLASPPAEKRRKNTFADQVQVTFPPRR
jgi:three-Cys-motif partner protein